MEEGSKDMEAEKAKSAIWARVEHPFYWVKSVFGYWKVRYRGIRKNMNRLHLQLGFGPRPVKWCMKRARHSSGLGDHAAFAISG